MARQKPPQGNNLHIKQLPSQDILKKLFKYDPINGCLINKTNRNHKKAGERSGTHDSKGYRRVFVNGQHYAEHRVIWVLAYGYIPRDKLIDHINRNRTDNRLDNLRLVSSSENNLNTSAIAMSRSGHRGVYQTRSGKYQAQIRRNGKKLYLGTFDTVDAASLAYQRASSKAKRVGKRYNPYRFSRPITAYEPCMFTGRIECLDKLASHMYAELFG